MHDPRRTDSCASDETREVPESDRAKENAAGTLGTVPAILGRPQTDSPPVADREEPTDRFVSIARATDPSRTLGNAVGVSRSVTEFLR